MRQEKDSWMTEDDTILAEITLKHIRSGSYELKAFEEAADRLERTASICSFRWNCVVREGYEKEINAAKAERKKLMTIS
jgi:prespore-specific regulator